METAFLSLSPHINHQWKCPYSFLFFVLFEKVFINENRGVQRLIQSMSDIPRKLFLQTQSHNCVNKLYSSPINKDSQKHNHVFFNFMSYLFDFP